MEDDINLTEAYDDRGIRVGARVYLDSEQKDRGYCGPGAIRLLEAIHKVGNVRHACASIDISYSKAWKILNALEKCLGFPVTVRLHGGGYGGGITYLTPRGKVFLEKHKAFQDACQQAVERIFTEYYLTPSQRHPLPP